jgi:hypothetical protein
MNCWANNIPAASESIEAARNEAKPPYSFTASFRAFYGKECDSFGTEGKW